MEGNAQQKKRELHPRLLTEGGAHALLWKSVQNSPLPHLNWRVRTTWEIIRASLGKAATDDFLAHFQSLHSHFFERVDGQRGQAMSTARKFCL